MNTPRIRRKAGTVLLATAMLAAGQGVAFAQPRAIDPTKLNHSLPVDKAPLSLMNQGAGNMTPELNGAFVGKTMPTKMFQGASTASTLQDRTAPSTFQKPFPQAKSIDTKMLDGDTYTSSLHGQMSGLNGKQSTMSQSNAYGKWQGLKAPQNLTNPQVFNPTANTGAQMPQSGRELTQRDVNRYAFHSSHPSETGLPIKQAGSGDGTEGPAAVLTNGKQLFDFGNTPTMRSGPSVTPVLITPGGARSYNPNTSLGGSTSALLPSGGSGESVPAVAASPALPPQAQAMSAAPAITATPMPSPQAAPSLPKPISAPTIAPANQTPSQAGGMKMGDFQISVEGSSDTGQ